MKYKIKNKKMKLSTEVLLAIIPPILILVLWEVLGKKGVINASILPYPSKIYRAFILQTSSGKLQANFFASIGRIVKGFIIGSFLGMLLGLIMGLVPIFDIIRFVCNSETYADNCTYSILYFVVGNRRRIKSSHYHTVQFLACSSEYHSGN